MIKYSFQLLLAVVCIGLVSPTLAGAEMTPISDLLEEASAGDVIELENYVYEEDVVIDQSITLQGGEETVIQGTGNGDVITIQADGVTIENIQITNSGTVLDHDHAGIKILSNHNAIHETTIEDSLHGIYLEGSKDNVLQDNTIIGNTNLNMSRRGNGIHLFHSSENMIKGNTIEQARDGIYFSFAEHNLIEDTSISNTRYGIHYMYSDYNKFYQNDFFENIGGVAIMYSDHIILQENRIYNHHDLHSFGVLFQTANDVTMENNQVHFNQKGIFLDQSNRNVIKNNQISNNRLGLEVWTSSTDNVFTENVMLDNNLQYSTNGNRDGNAWSEDGVGNAWSDHQFIDFNQDGISDRAYEYRSAFGEVLAEEQLGVLFLDSPALGLYESWNRLFLTDGGLIEDPAPIQVTENKGSAYVLIPVAVIAFVFVIVLRRRKGASSK